MNNQSNDILRISHVARYFQQGDQELHVLKDIDLTIKSGEIVALVGASGSGKSTLLHLAGLLESPSSGQIIIDNIDASQLNDNARTTLRRNVIGFVYQFHHLLPEFTARDNIVLPQMIAGIAVKQAHIRAQKLLESLNLGNRADHRPPQLSGGEQQRIAILRAIANKPRLLLADEPTGNLDEATADIVFAELIELVRHQKMGALVATHNPQLAKRMDRTVKLCNGRLTEYSYY